MMADKKWFVVHAYSGFEKSVQRALTERIKRSEIAEKFGQAALTYQHNPTALHLRAMNMLYEAIKEKGSMVIVPSSAVETMGLGGMLGTASMGGASVVTKQ